MIVAEDRERVSGSEVAARKFYLDRYDLKTLNEEEIG
jgi:hypothetical protein